MYTHMDVIIYPDTLDDGNIGCGFFVDLQKAFNTVDHQILLAKLNHFGIRGVSIDWFLSLVCLIAIIIYP